MIYILQRALSKISNDNILRKTSKNQNIPFDSMVWTSSRKKKLTAAAGSGAKRNIQSCLRLPRLRPLQPPWPAPPPARRPSTSGPRTRPQGAPAANAALGHMYHWM